MYKFNTMLEPLWVSKVQLHPGQEVKAHAHEYYYHMVYINSGHCDFVINGENYVLSDNMLTIARPKEVLGWQNASGVVVSSYEIKFSILDDDLQDMLAELPPVIYSNLFIRTLLEKIVCEKDKRHKDFAEYIGIYLNTLLYDLVRGRMDAPPEESIEARRRSPAQIAARYIEDHYGEDLSLDSIAEAISFNKSYLATAFKRATGVTVNEYIYKTRVYKACEQIAYSDLPLLEVSEMTGFKNVQHFNRVFKKYIGIPPGEYRSATPKQLINYENADGAAFNVDVLPVRSGRNFEVESDSGFFRPEHERRN